MSDGLGKDYPSDYESDSTFTGNWSSTNDMNTSSPVDKEIIENLHFAWKLVLIIWPTLIYLVGIPGNMLTVLVLKRRSMKDSLFSTFLAMLCVFNVWAMCIGLSRHYVMGLTNFNIRLYSMRSCVIHSWMTITMITSCNWLLAVITTFRLCYLRYPDRIIRNVTPFRIVAATVAMVVLIGIGEGIILWWRSILTQSTVDHGRLLRCSVDRHHPIASLQQFVYFYIPAIIISSMSVIIYCHVVQETKPSSGMFRRGTTIAANKSLARLLLITNICFVVATLPSNIFIGSTDAIFDKSTELGKAERKLGHAIATCFLYSGYAVNFVIYALVGSRFRRELWRIVNEKCPGCLPQTVVKLESITPSTTNIRSRAEAGPSVATRETDSMRNVPLELSTAGSQVFSDAVDSPHYVMLMSNRQSVVAHDVDNDREVT